MDKLTEKEQNFIDAYLINGGNGTRAVMKAYPNVKDKRNAGAMARQILKRPKVKKAIEHIRRNLKILAEYQGVTPEKILNQYANIAFANLLNVMSWDDDSFHIKNSDELTDDEAATIFEVISSRSSTGFSVKVKQYNKMQALDSLVKLLGYADDKMIITDEITDKESIINKLLGKVAEQRSREETSDT